MKLGAALGNYSCIREVRCSNPSVTTEICVSYRILTHYRQSFKIMLRMEYLLVPQKKILRPPFP